MSMKAASASRKDGQDFTVACKSVIFGAEMLHPKMLNLIATALLNSPADIKAIHILPDAPKGKEGDMGHYFPALKSMALYLTEIRDFTIDIVAKNIQTVDMTIHATIWMNLLHTALHEIGHGIIEDQIASGEIDPMSKQEKDKAADDFALSTIELMAEESIDLEPVALTELPFVGMTILNAMGNDDTGWGGAHTDRMDAGIVAQEIITDNNGENPQEEMFGTIKDFFADCKIEGGLLPETAAAINSADDTGAPMANADDTSEVGVADTQEHEVVAQPVAKEVDEPTNAVVSNDVVVADENDLSHIQPEDDLFGTYVSDEDTGSDGIVEVDSDYATNVPHTTMDGGAFESQPLMQPQQPAPAPVVEGPMTETQRLVRMMGIRLHFHMWTQCGWNGQSFSNIAGILNPTTITADEAKLLTSYTTVENSQWATKTTENCQVAGRSYSNNTVPGYLVTVGGKRFRVLAQNPARQSWAAQLVQQGHTISFFIMEWDGTKPVDAWRGMVLDGEYYIPTNDGQKGLPGWKKVAL